MNLRSWAMALVAIVLPLAAAAKTRDGVTLPDAIELGGKSLVLNGLGIREATVFNVHVYVAGLYVTAASSDASAILDADEPKQITMRFKRDVEREKLVDAFHEGFEKFAGEAAAKALDVRAAPLYAALADVKAGQEIRLAYVPGTGTTLAVDGKVSRPIAGADFGRAAFGIYLGPKPPNSSLKDGLLGKS
jgi:hypothetical protein